MSLRAGTSRRRLGAAAESAAASFLQARGLEVIDRNVDTAGGEVDLVVMDRSVRVAVEVRSITGKGTAADAFDGAKAAQVWKLAASLRPPCSRVDLVAVRFGERYVEIHWIPSIS